MQTLQFGGSVHPQQYGGITSGYSPYQTDWTSMFSAMMPMIMMIMMFAILMPMFKGMTESAK
jgi:hypothetical protein